MRPGFASSWARSPVRRTCWTRASARCGPWARETCWPWSGIAEAERGPQRRRLRPSNQYRLLLDWLAVRSEDEPDATDLMAIGIAGSTVAGEGGGRVIVHGQLGGAVVAGKGPQRLGHATVRLRRRLDLDGRPGGEARRGAGALA